MMLGKACDGMDTTIRIEEIGFIRKERSTVLAWCRTMRLLIM